MLKCPKDKHRILRLRTNEKNMFYEYGLWHKVKGTEHDSEKFFCEKCGDEFSLDEINELTFDDNRDFLKRRGDYAGIINPRIDHTTMPAL